MTTTTSVFNSSETDGDRANFFRQTALSTADEMARNIQRIVRLPFLWEKAQAVKKGATPSEVVYEEDRLKLLHYTGDVPVRYRTPLVFVFALVNRPYILDLKDGKSVVQHFVKAGFDTYLVDWGVPTEADRYLTFDDYINGYMPHVIEHVCQRTGSERASMLGYCMGGTMSAMFTALHQRLVKNLILMAAGIDFGETEDERAGLLQRWTHPDVFDVDRFVDAFGNAPPQFLQASFLLLKPVQNFLEKPIGLFERLDDDAYVEDFLAMEGWLNDNIAVPGEVFREFVKYLYQQNLLVKRKLRVGKKLVDLKNITCPVLNLMAQKDDLVPCSQSAPFNDLVGSSDRRTIQFPAGHIGLAVGSKAQNELWPGVCEWLAARSEVVEPGLKDRG